MSNETGDGQPSSTAEQVENAALSTRTDAKAARVDAEAASASATQASDARTAAETAATNAAASAAKRPLPLIVTFLLTELCMAAAFYIGCKMLGSADSATVTDGTRRLQISALVCFLGMAFACLGFGLFLVGATGAFKGSSNGNGKSAIGVETAAPGLVVMVCATIVIYLALDVIKPTEPPAPSSGSPASAGSGSAASTPAATAPSDAAPPAESAPADPGSAPDGARSAIHLTPSPDAASPR